MKVAFWNGVSSADGVTNHMAAIGTLLSYEQKCEVVLGSNHISSHMLQDCFSSRTEEEKVAHAPYQLSYGTTEYSRALWDMKRNRQDNIVEMPMEGVTIIYPPDVADKKMFYYEVPWTTLYLLDIGGENNIASQSALEEADLIVVFLPQNVTELQNFFYRFSSLIPDDIFVIDGFQKDGCCTKRSVAEKYRINRNNIGIIPPNKEYTEACEEGRLESFLKNNLRPMKKEPQYLFMSNIRYLAKRLREYRDAKREGVVE